MSIVKRYKEIFKKLEIEKIDLFIAHLGSIKDYELKDPEYDPEKPLFYPNHLGLRGLTILMDGVPFKVGIISEFGEELKNIRCDIAKIIQTALKDENKIVIPGDTTLVWNLADEKILCHRPCCFIQPKYIKIIEDVAYGDTLHIYLVQKNEPQSRQSEMLKRYHDALVNRELPHFRLSEI